MEEKKYSKKSEQKLLVAIYRKYVKAQGDQPSQLDVYKFNSFDNDIYETTPEILLEPLGTNIRLSVNSKYSMNLRDQGFIERKHPRTLDVFLLTKSGFFEAKRLINPYRYFLIKHWRYLMPMSLTFILILIAIIRLTICK